MSIGIIFDCDGVLVDSEIISCKVSVEFLKKYLNFNKITVDEFIDMFTGVPFEKQLEQLDVKYGTNLLNNFKINEKELKQIRDKMKVEALKNVKAINGVEEFLCFLKKTDTMLSIASGAGLKKLYTTLTSSGLKKYFDDEFIFSADCLKSTGTKKDIFIKAKELLESKKIDFNDIIVIEDSDKGAFVAKEIGLKVFGFCGASHITDKLKKQLKDIVGGENIFYTMKEVQNKIKEILK